MCFRLDERFLQGISWETRKTWYDLQESRLKESVEACTKKYRETLIALQDKQNLDSRDPSLSENQACLLPPIMVQNDGRQKHSRQGSNLRSLI